MPGARGWIELLRPLCQVLPVRADSVTALAGPAQFHSRLISGIAAARNRITVAALYVGVDGVRERELVSALRAAADKPGGPRVTVLVDALRGGRRGFRGAGTTVAGDLAEALGPRARVALFGVPGRLAPALRPPFGEALGVCHLKGAVFDDNVRECCTVRCCADVLRHA